MKISVKKIVSVFILLAVVIFIFVVVIILSDRYIFIAKDNPSESSQLSELSESFQKISEDALFLVDINNIMADDELNNSETISFFDISGQPLFFKSDPAYYGEIIEYSPDRRYALEISTSEPDSSASLWDLNNKKVYFIAQCGTACSLSGGYWRDNNQVLVFGTAEDYDVAQDKYVSYQFVNIYNLFQNIKTVYSDKK